MFIGIDQSKRSTAAVVINSNRELEDFILVLPPKQMDGEELLVFVADKLVSFSSKFLDRGLKGIAVEGLSYNSTSSGKDLLAGLFWVIRTRLYVDLPTIPVGVIPVLTWRSKVLSKEERKALSEVKVKDGLKRATVDKLPYLVKARFEEYILEVGAKKESLYDLSDAYFVAQYRRSIE